MAIKSDIISGRFHSNILFIVNIDRKMVIISHSRTGKHRGFETTIKGASEY